MPTSNARIPRLVSHRLRSDGANPLGENPKPVRLDVQLRSELLVQDDSLGTGAHVVRPATLPPLSAKGLTQCGPVVAQCGPVLGVFLLSPADRRS
jgi:hypothetical protein